MKHIRSIVTLLAIVISPLFARAQDAETTFSDEELTKYAAVMKWAEVESSALSSVVRDSVSVWLDGSSLSASQYNILNKASKKGTISEVESTEEELSTFSEIKAKIDERTLSFTDTYKSKIKEDIGAGLYNSLRKAMKADEAVKSRYEVILASLTEEPTIDSEDDMSDSL
ncbi:MAG: hypothetical protein ACI8QD_000216 [Cyclobacteriaceae bacterium]|jgi:hypothetical protein